MMKHTDPILIVKKRLKWFYPGMKVKRYISMVIVGVMIFSMGAVFIIGKNIPRDVYLYVTTYIRQGVVGITLAILGGVLIFYGIRNLNRRFVNLLMPGVADRLVDKVYEEAYLQHGVKVVGVGGGTGMHSLLRGLKEYTSNITAVVTVSDDGGSSGQIREEMKILPPGDIRQCLAALADSETAMVELFQKRFKGDGFLKNHTVGNVLLAAMAEMKGDFYQAVQELSKVLAVRGRVLPSTLDSVTLCAELKDGTIVRGETNVTESLSPVQRVFLSPSNSRALPEAINALQAADAVIIGPGSLYTSIIPNLLVPGIRSAIQKTNALKIYVCNIMTQPGETDSYSAADHAAQIAKILGQNSIDVIIVNRAYPVLFIEKYKEQGATPVEIDIENLRKLGIHRIVQEDLLLEEEVVRHNPKKLAALIITILKEEHRMPPFSIPSELDKWIEKLKIAATGLKGL
ncbi:MAG: gluconeogenesis factor YvcK family protein [bacterium]